MAGAGVKLVGDWVLSKKILEAAPGDLKQALAKAKKAEAVSLAADMKKRFANLKPANSPFTILTKGSSKPGIDKGDLKNAIGATPMGDDWFVGIPASAKVASGSAARLANIIEHGITIVMRMSDKQRKFLHAKFAHKVQSIHKGGTGILIIHIPPRPFIAPAIEAAQNGASERFLKRLSQYLKVLKI